MKSLALYIITFFMCFKPVFPVMEYMLNYEYIARVLCENKDKPELECNGQCYLMKSLAEEAAQDSPGQPEPKPGFELQLVFFKALDFHHFENFHSNPEVSEILNSPDTYSYLFNIQLLKPPIS